MSFVLPLMIENRPIGSPKPPKIESKMTEKLVLEAKGRIHENERESNARVCFFAPRPLPNPSKIYLKSIIFLTRFQHRF